MRLSLVKSKNAIQFYVIKSFRNSNGKNTSKIIEKLEYNRIIKQLSDLAITAPAKEQALTLMPSSNFDEVKKSIDQTRVLSNIYELKDQCR